MDVKLHFVSSLNGIKYLNIITILVLKLFGKKTFIELFFKSVIIFLVSINYFSLMLTFRIKNPTLFCWRRLWEDVTTGWSESWTRAILGSSIPPLSLECAFHPPFPQWELFSRSWPWESNVLLKKIWSVYMTGPS